jgi:hypothetical protein
MENLLPIPQQAMGPFGFVVKTLPANFFCAEDEGYIYEKAITAWRCTEEPHLRCDEHRSKHIYTFSCSPYPLFFLLLNLRFVAYK